MATPPPTQPDRRLIVAVDGPGSSGKSSVGAAAAARLGYRFFDTGLLYRAVAWLAIRRGIADDDAAGLAALVGEVELATDAAGRLARVLVDGRDVADELHTPEVDARVSAVSGVPEVRRALVGRQRAIAAGGGIVMAGRDIGTVILPDADLKVFLDASVEERAARRAAERSLAPADPEYLALLESLRRRDQHDRTRAVAPLRPAPDARLLVTDGNTLEQTVDLVVAAIQEAAAAPGPGSPSASASPAAPEASPPGALAPAAAAPEGSTGPARPRRDAARDDATEIAARRARKGLPVTPIADRFTFVIRVCTWIAASLAHCVTRVRIEGDLDAVPRQGPVILIANHSSNADPVVVGAFVAPRLGRPLNWLGKKEVFDIPVLGWAARRCGIHAVERSAVDVEAFRIAQRILDAGCILAVFPEGTRSRTGELQEVKDGLAVLAQRSGAPIVPVAIVDADKVWRRGQRMPRIGGRIVIRVGAPFTLAPDAPGARGGARREAKGAATRRMMGAIAAMLPPRQRGVYADAAEPFSTAAGPAEPAG